MRSHRKCVIVSILCLIVWATTARAQKAPGLGYAYPPAIPIGQTSAIQLGGFDFTVDMEWFVHDARVRLIAAGPPGDYLLAPPPYWIGPRTSTPAVPIPREVAARIEVDSQAPAGLLRFQVANANGSSSTSMIYLSDGPETVESRSRDFPQRLPTLPVAVSGRLSRLTEVDRYILSTERDGLVSVDLMARRLGADFHGAMEVHDQAGKRIADFADTEGLDGGLIFAAKAGAPYTVGVHDIDFRGDRAYVYRLALTQGPRVLCTIPAAGRRGTATELEFVGPGVATGKPVLESLRQVVSFPTDPARVSYIHVLKTPFGDVKAPIPLSNLNEIARDPGTLNGSSIAFAVAAPAAVTSRLSPDSNEHVYSWHAEKEESWKLALQSRGIGGRLDVSLSVSGPDGGPLGDNDDLPGLTDAELDFRAPATGQYTCIVRNMSSRTGALDELYRLQIERIEADFALTVPQQVNLPLGGKTEVTVQAVRSGGFDGAIVVSVEGLPDGVTARGELTIPPGKNELKIVLQAASGAAVVARPIQFRGTSKIRNGSATRLAFATAGGNLCPHSLAEQTIPRVLLAMTMDAPIEVRVVDRESQHDVHRGTTYPAELEIVRQHGFAGAIRVEMSARQSRYIQGIHGPIIDVPATATRVFYPCFMPEWLGTDLTERIVVHGVAALADPKGNLRYLTKPGDSRITMIMEGALLKLTAEASEQPIRPGESLGVPVRIARSAKLPIAATITLEIPTEAAGLLRADPLVLEPGQDRGMLIIRSASDNRLEGPWSLKLKATALRDGKWPVISQTDLPVVFARR
jgi:hypothetical protein